MIDYGNTTSQSIEKYIGFSEDNRNDLLTSLTKDNIGSMYYEVDSTEENKYTGGWTMILIQGEDGLEWRKFVNAFVY